VGEATPATVASFRSNVRDNAANQAALGVELVDIRLLEVQASAA
jgi:hypothetical protein